MRFRPPLVEGTLIRRYKRFLADIRLAGGQEITAHCPNPGAMTSCARVGRPAWVSPADRPSRKLAWTWQVAKPGRALVLVNTHLANGVVSEGLRRGRIAELAGYDRVRREVPLPDGRGRADFRLEGGGRRPCWLEVKSVTLRAGDGTAAFPDAVTARGTRHLEALAAAVARGERGVLLFLVGRADVTEVRPADAIDPLYASTLRRVTGRGVEVLAYRATVRTASVSLGAPLPYRAAPSSVAR